MTETLQYVLDSDPIVVVVDDAVLTATAADRVRALSPRIELQERMSPAALRRAHVVFTTMGTFDPADAPSLRWIQTESASIAHLLETKLAVSDIPVANARGALSPNVAELAVGMLLTLTRRLAKCHSIQSQQRWPARDEHQALYGVPCYAKTLGILGYGSIGRQTARIASGLGMRVLACNKTGCQSKYEGFSLPNTGDAEGDLPAGWYTVEQFDEMLPACDVVVLCLPLTPETRHLFNEDALHLLSDHALLIDVGRGGVLHLEALCNCLRSGGLAGAALDVYEQEPLPKDHPLWRVPNIMLTPHIGAGTRNRNDFVAEVLLENLSRFLHQRELINLVNFSRGY